MLTRAPCTRAACSALVILAALCHAHVASAQMCGEAPPDFHPHMDADVRDTLVVSAALAINVHRTFSHCTYGRGTARLAPDDVRIEIVGGPAETVLRWRRSRGDSRLVVRLPEYGDYELRVSSPSAPTLEPATVRVRFVDRATFVPVVLRAAGGAPDAHFPAMQLTTDGYSRWVPARPNRSGSLRPITTRLPVGSYTVRLGSPYASAWAELSVTGAGAYEFVFGEAERHADPPPSP